MELEIFLHALPGHARAVTQFNGQARRRIGICRCRTGRIGKQRNENGGGEQAKRGYFDAVNWVGKVGGKNVVQFELPAS